jgi:hypothetical protein
MCVGLTTLPGRTRGAVTVRGRVGKAVLKVIAEHGHRRLESAVCKAPLQRASPTKNLVIVALDGPGGT